MTDLDVLNNYLSRAGITDSEYRNKLVGEFIPHKVNQGEFLVQVGGADPRLFFILKGLLRIYYIDHSGREFTKAFVSENMFYTGLTSYLVDEPSGFSVEALETCELLFIDYACFEQAVKSDLSMANLWRNYMQAHFVRHEKREASLLLSTGKEKYLNFLAQYPGLEKRIPQYQIASYIGLTEASLSRVKRQLKE